MLEVSWDNQTKTLIDRQELIAHLNSILRRLLWPDTLKIELVIVGDEQIKQLNRDYRQVNRVTDVLSFPDFGDELTPEQGAGSIVIAAPHAAKQAREAGISLQDEVKMLATHGLLHLLGYHHK